MPVAFNRLLPAGEPLSAREFVARLGLPDGHRPQAASQHRPRLLLNMASTTDGRASIAGRSGGIGNTADRELFHALRSAVDAVLVGAGTVQTEHYRRLIRDSAERERRRERGLAEEPLACIVSGRLALEGEVPLLDEPAAHVAILTPSQGSLSGRGAQIEYVRTQDAQGHLDLRAALGALRERFAVRTVLCEGGPHLNAQLLAAGLVDELFLSFAPLLAGGGATTDQALRIVTGAEFDPPLALELLEALEYESHLFLRYGVGSPEERRG